MNKIGKTSMGRVYKFCALKNVKFPKYVFNSAYRRKMTKEICANMPMGSSMGAPNFVVQKNCTANLIHLIYIYRAKVLLLLNLNLKLS